jgi:hypothetical protein
MYSCLFCPKELPNEKPDTCILCKLKCRAYLVQSNCNIANCLIRLRVLLASCILMHLGWRGRPISTTTNVEWPARLGSGDHVTREWTATSSGTGRQRRTHICGRRMQATSTCRCLRHGWYCTPHCMARISLVHRVWILYHNDTFIDI